MLLSMLISYRLAGRFSSQTYAVSMAGWVILASLVTTFLAPAWILFMFLYPFVLLSFPFFSTVEQLHSYTPITAHNIQLFTLKIASIPHEFNGFAYSHLFFLLVNLAGVILGYWIDERLLKESLKRKMLNFFFYSVIWSIPAFYFINLSYFYAVGAATGYYLSENTQFWYTLWNILILFITYLFWTPALIAAIIYGIYKRSTKPPE